MNLANRDYQEKRNFIRMLIEAPIAVFAPNGSPPIQGTCHNLSGGGMLISIPAPLPIGTRAEVIINSNHGHNPVLKALVQVNRLHEPTTPAAPHQLGLQIVQLLE